MQSDPYLMNRLGTCKNPYQGKQKKVLCVCSAGLLRSPTAALVLATQFNYNTRAAGITPQFALIPVDQVLLTWADEIVCMSDEQETQLKEMCRNLGLSTPIVNLDIPDAFSYGDPTLKSTIRYKYLELTRPQSPGVHKA